MTSAPNDHCHTDTTPTVGPIACSSHCFSWQTSLGGGPRDEQRERSLRSGEGAAAGSGSKHVDRKIPPGRRGHTT